jgi:hypothetical protein
MSLIPGKAIIRELPMSTVEKLLLIDNNQPSFLADDIDDTLTIKRISINTRFFAVLFAIVQGLSVRRKLKLLNSPGIALEEGWIFTDDTRGEFTLMDIIKTSLYMDLKQEFAFKNLSLTCTQEVLHFSQSTELNNNARIIIIEVMSRLKKEMRSRSWSPFHELYAHYQALNHIYD